MVFLKAYRYRFYPTVGLEIFLAKTFGCCRFVYNHFLEAKEQHYKNHKKSLSYGECASQLADLKNTYLFLKEVSSVALQQSLRHLETAFQRFYKREGQFPKKKKRRHQQSATFMKNSFTYRGGEITLAKCKVPLNIRWSRRFVGEPTSITITRDSRGRYYISVLVEEVIKPLPRLDKTIGIDLGLKALITTSDKEIIQAKKALKRRLKHLKIRQRALSRKTKGSSNRTKARMRVAKLSGKIQDIRKDTLHKQSRKLVNENQVICAETLDVKKMMKNKKLAREIGDAGWGTLLQFLKYKSAWYGRQFVEVPQFFPSTKQCSHCKGINQSLTLEDRVWMCPHCSTQHDRDVTAAINIREEGLRMLNTVGHTGIKACGVDVRPIWQTRGLSTVNQELGL